MFELSKVQTVAIRARMVSHLLNIDAELAQAVARGLRLEPMPAPMPAAKPTRQDLPPSPKLSILRNGPSSFAGRTIGALVTDGTDAGVLAALRKAQQAEGAALKLIAPQVGGVVDSAGARHPADEALGGGPSVLFDAVAVLPSRDGVAALAALPPARDFVADAVAHHKFIGYAATAAPLFEKAGATLDEGFVRLDDAGAAAGFVTTCRRLRFWDRGAKK